MKTRWPAYWLAALLGGAGPVLGVAPPAVAATVINVAATGNDTPGCGSAAVPCASVPFAYNEAAPGDTIRVQAGTYVMTSPLVIRKADLHLEGAQAGVDARTRTPGGQGETVITTTLNTPIQEDMWIAQANGVSIDGFTFTGNADGAGVTTSENFSGYAVENDIFSNNLKGFAPSSNGAIPSVFEQNLFIGNNNATLHPGAQGNGVFTYRPLANATFAHSTFQDNGNAPINIAGGEVPGATRNITIADNDMDGEFPVTLVVVSDAVVTRNSMIGGWSGVQVSGACHDIEITHNTIADKTRGGVLLFTGFAAVTNTDITIADNTMERTGTFTDRFGVEISNSSGVTVLRNRIVDSGHDAIGFTPRGQETPSSDTTITQNTITGSGGSGVFVAQGAYSGPMTVQYNRIVDSGSGQGLVDDDPAADIDARYNWWGCNDMPNGGGCDHVAGTADGQVEFQPWLVLTIHSEPAGIAAGQQAQITASLQNDSSGNSPVGPFFHQVLTTFTADPGTLAPDQVITDASLHATTTWPAGQPRPELICATVDHETVCLNFEVSGGSIISKVIDKKTRNPVGGAEVRITDTADDTVGTCTTDANGTCDVEDLPPGTYGVCIVGVPDGYALPRKPCISPVIVEEHVETQVTFVLREEQGKDHGNRPGKRPCKDPGKRPGGKTNPKGGAW
ncbi:right-handed parallel beta-helix repeat-containing protein [Streptomyces sp. NPDC020917]|uniref:right-handed parallel beta-helix repeat-containing protein n=1 Tax=Streptomyces sp. NPDC020917 TaxID=3365102 RepID=UPI0037A68BD4